MPRFGPINDRFIELVQLEPDVGASIYLKISDSASLKPHNTQEVFLDFMVRDYPTTTRAIFGKSVTADWAFTLTANGELSFVSRRAGGDVNSTASLAQAIGRGERHVIVGVDDGETVKLWIDGELAATTGTSQSGQIVKDTNEIFIGSTAAAALGTNIRVYGAQIKYDGSVVFRFMPQERSGSTVRDLSGYGQAIVIEGSPKVEGTDYWWGSGWNIEPMVHGLEPA